ncbi:MAG: hypothetical protein P4L85_00810 [Paludisphaera borealis]|uniref:hypothetical protein n=1 Tax=Paludisphaera borealis TaxID=1387353 RepID=UPI0028430028|nr:hypothetical protein [Paludisphaera borealis]MDR3617861.1 hypothetical protein [Paludisphaera borealis]
MRHLLRRLSLSGFLFVAAGSAMPSGSVDAQEAPESSPAPKPAPKPSAKKPLGLRILAPVVCKSIEGYEDYETLPDAELTSDEKLLVYYRPKGHKVVRQGDEYVAHLMQDGQVRRLGQKKVLLRKAKLLDYEAKSDIPPDEIYIRNTFSLKGLPPGEYEYDMILKDLNAKPATVTVTESVKFRVVAAKLPEPDPETKPDAEERF